MVFATGAWAKNIDTDERWDPHLSPPQIQKELRKLDLTGDLKRPITIAHGTAAAILATSEHLGANVYEIANGALSFLVTSIGKSHHGRDEPAA